jgi:hypothetical protein
MLIQRNSIPIFRVLTMFLYPSFKIINKLWLSYPFEFISRFSFFFPFLETTIARHMNLITKFIEINQQMPLNLLSLFRHVCGILESSLTEL